MRAVTFDVSVPRFILAKTLGRVSESAFYGAPSGVSLVDIPEPSLPGDRWVRLEILKCGSLSGLTQIAHRFETFLMTLLREVQKRSILQGAPASPELKELIPEA